MKILNTIYWALFNMSFAALYCFYYAIPLTILTISIIALSSIILAFIEYKAHLYYIDNMGHLYNCIEENNTKESLDLIEYGASVNATNYFGETPLHCSISNGDTEIAIALIESGANVNATNYFGETPLHCSISNGDTEIAIALIGHGADVNAYDCNDETPLHLAAKCGNTKTAIALIERGADVHAADNYGGTPLHWAAKMGHTQTAIALIEHGADINATKNNGDTPLHLAAFHVRIEAVIALMEYGANLPEYRSSIVLTLKIFDWWTPLHTAVINNNLNEIRNLEYIPSETSPFDIAIMIGNIDAARTLIERGIQYDKDKCLITATYSNRLELAQLFLEKGANPLSKNQLGQTALHFAAARGNENIMEIFVDNIRKKDNAAISIQRGYRSYLFKKNKANSTQEPTPPPSLGGPKP
jgi:ankyrin repeat protein